MRQLVHKLLLLLLSILVAALALELVLVVGGWSAGLPVQVVPGKGIRFLPGSSYTHSKEGFSRNTFNSHGFRDRERTWEKPDGTFRILVLGDSYVEAMQVALEESFPWLLEAALESRAGGRKFEVLALGQSGFGTTESLIRYRHFGRLYDPDLVLLTVTTANDFRNNHKVLNGGAIGHYYGRGDEGGLVLDDSSLREYERSMGWMKSAYTWARLRSRLVGLVSRRIQLLRRQWNSDRAAAGAVADGMLEPGSDLNIYLDDAGPLWADATRITRDVLFMAAREIEKDGVRLAVVSLTNAEQVHRDIGVELQSRIGLPLELARPERLLASWCREAGIPYLAFLPGFQAAYDENGIDLHGFGDRRTGHWNQAGHRLAAHEILLYLEEAGLLECDSPAPEALAPYDT